MSRASEDARRGIPAKTMEPCESGGRSRGGRFIRDRIIDSPYPATGPPVCLQGRGTERLCRRATAVRATGAYPGKLPRAGGSRADAKNGTPGPVAVTIGLPYGAVGPFRPRGVPGTRRSAPLAQERGTAPRVAGPEGKRRA